MAGSGVYCIGYGGGLITNQAKTPGVSGSLISVIIDEMRLVAMDILSLVPSRNFRLEMENGRLAIRFSDNAHPVGAGVVEKYLESKGFRLVRSEAIDRGLGASVEAFRKPYGDGFSVEFIIIYDDNGGRVISISASVLYDPR